MCKFHIHHLTKNALSDFKDFMKKNMSYKFSMKQ